MSDAPRVIEGPHVVFSTGRSPAEAAKVKRLLCHLATHVKAPGRGKRLLVSGGYEYAAGSFLFDQGLVEVDCQFLSSGISEADIKAGQLPGRLVGKANLRVLHLKGGTAIAVKVCYFPPKQGNGLGPRVTILPRSKFEKTLAANLANIGVPRSDVARVVEHIIKRVRAEEK